MDDDHVSALLRRIDEPVDLDHDALHHERRSHLRAHLAKAGIDVAVITNRSISAMPPAIAVMRPFKAASHRSIWCFLSSTA